MRILLVEDEEYMAQAVAQVLEKNNYTVDLAHDGEYGLDCALSGIYDIIILDIMLPGHSGLEILKTLRQERIAVPVLLLTVKSETEDKVIGLDLGADDYLTKPFDIGELIARILSLIRRYTRFNQLEEASRQLDYDGLSIDLDNHTVTSAHGTFELPPKEFDVLLLLAKHQGKILTKKQIYEEVWGEEYCYDDSNIMAIISRLRKKIEENPGAAKYIQTIKGIGYRFNKEV